MIYGQFGVYLGDRTNNEAEYEAFLQALSHADRDTIRDVVFRVDSLLLCRQMNGEWGVEVRFWFPCTHVAWHSFAIFI